MCCYPLLSINHEQSLTRELLRVELIVVVLLEETLVESVWPVVLKLRPVQVILEIVVLSEPNPDPEGNVAGDVVADLPPPLHLDLLDDDFWPEFSEHLCRFFAGNFAAMLDSQQNLLIDSIRSIFWSDGSFNGACELDVILQIFRIVSFVFVSKILISFVD